ncbi:MAG: TonB-dependent receptor [Flavobacteriales bacterium]|nr:TonB-dependent receptor [Flavobacteriales bacterium]
MLKTKHLLSSLLLFIISFATNAQEITQTIRGQITDSESRLPLMGANIILLSDTANFTGTTADVDGYFKLENIPLGRHKLKISFLGYQTMIIPNIVVGSGKEFILNLSLEESAIKMEEFEITATENRGDALNEMAIISSRAFTVAETEKYAGTRGDPARMASNFAGVGGADDSRNDIVVRGNSPMGVLWRFEGIDIPNPNHFAVSGTQGGPTSIINNKYLANSDFFTGAFPAEYGNSLSGVFDLKMRAGNNEKHEQTFQFGILGTELMLEGPISKEKHSSYLINYRYSTLTFFNKLGIDVGTSAKLVYQDAAFKFNFPMKKGGNFSVFGIGGMSDIDIVISEQKPEDREIYGEQDRDQYFGTKMGVVGATLTKTLGEKAYFKATVAQTFENQHTYHQLIYYTQNPTSDSTFEYVLDNDGYYKSDSLVDLQRFQFNIGKTTGALFVNKKFNSKHVVKIGTNFDVFYLNFQDSIYGTSSTYKWRNRWDDKETTLLVQPYIQWKWKLSEKLTVNAGLHNQYFALNNTYSLAEPRAGLRWDINDKQNLSFGIGKHSQIHPLYIYTYQIPDGNGGFVQHNRDIGMTKSMHYILGYNRFVGKSMRIKSEVYYQQLSNVPVEVESSSFSLLNQGVGFQRFFPDSLQNTGTGTNYGVELTIEKFFTNQYFFMLTGSYYESFYKGSDGVTRDTDFNGNYILNFLGAKEFTVLKNNAFTIGAKVTYAGNKRYGPVDIDASEANAEIIYIDAERNTKQFDPYFRTDIKLNYKINRKKVSHEISIDLVNVTGNENILKLSYAPNLEDPTQDPIREEYQLGFLPIFYYRIDF